MRVIELLVDFIYLCFIILLIPYFLYKIIRCKKYRIHFWERFGAIKPRKNRNEKPCIWIHAVSVGETIASEPLINELKNSLPEFEIVLSVTTKTGREVALKKLPDIFSFQFPLDLSYAVKKTFRRIKPSIVILLELEVWPNFMIHAERMKVPVFIANGRLSEKSYKGYKRASRIIGFMFRRVNLALAQSEEYAERFAKMGVQKVETVGTMKYDNVNVSFSTDLQKKYKNILNLADEDKLIIAGSTHPPEHLVVAQAHRMLLDEGFKVRLVLVPRHPEKYERVKNDLHKERIEFELRSLTKKSEGLNETIFFVDTMGELAGIYSVGDIAFVGGSLIPHGGQNMIEPAGFGVVPVFGKNYWNFTLPADELLKENAALLLNSKLHSDALINSEQLKNATNEFYSVCKNLLDDSNKLSEMKRNAIHVVEKGKGAAKRTVEAIRDYIYESI